MFERGGRLLPSAWRVPLIPYTNSIYSLWPQKKAATRTTPLATSRKRALLALPVWLASLAWVWIWWFNLGRIDSPGLYIPLSAALFYQFAILPSAFLFFVLKAKNPPRRNVMKGKKVAIITLCVPAQESIKIIERQLKAMSEVTYPHDSWILDEGNSKKVKKLAKKYGIKYFSRKGVKKYNQEDYPFKSKTKAGNVNAWLDHVKRYEYDFFAQLDIDHAPKPNLLNKTLGYFRDKNVGWVQSPAVYSNTDNWIARGAAEHDWTYHGPVQMGFYGFSGVPMVVGSQCIYRTSAIKEIGGFQPTRAEDHLDTVAMVSKGWKGVFQPDVVAEGHGPESFEAFFTQQFAWAYSMCQVMMRHSFKYLLKIRSPRKLMPILFCETFYPFLSLSYAITFFVPLLALATNRNVVNMGWGDLLVRLLPVSVALGLVWFSGRPLTPTKDLRISWRGALLEIVRWPALLLGILNALAHVKKPYMVTPKGEATKDAPSARVYLPFIFLGLLSSCLVVLISLLYGTASTSRLGIFAIINTVLVAIICLLDLNLRLRGVKKKRRQLSFSWLKPVTVIMILLIMSSMSLVTSPLVQASMVQAVSWQTPAPALIGPSVMPVNKLSFNDLLQQISTFQKPSDSLPPSVGIHDPTNIYDSKTPYIRESFIDWTNTRMLAEDILSSERLGATPLITIEPDGYPDGQALLKGISNGEFDNRLQRINQVLSYAKQPVYIRFMHEMDLAPNTAFTWTGHDPQLFISAYRHTVELNREYKNPNIKWVWSPIGNIMGSGVYYPGDDVVDIVGTTILYDRHYTQGFDWSQLSYSRLWLKHYNKPVWVAEFGIDNTDPSYQEQLLSQSAAQFRQVGLSALIYINIRDSHNIGMSYQYNNPIDLSKTLGFGYDEPRPATTSINQLTSVRSARTKNSFYSRLISYVSHQTASTYTDLHSFANRLFFSDSHAGTSVVKQDQIGNLDAVFYSTAEISLNN